MCVDHVFNRCYNPVVIELGVKGVGVEPTATGAEALLSEPLAVQREALAGGELSATELVRASLERARRLQPLLKPFRVLLDDEALAAAAAAADSRLAAGERLPLLGLPVAIKDEVDYAGHSTPFGCAGTHRPATAHSEIVHRLQQAGAVIVGKTMTCEVGQWHFSESKAFGTARNPHDPDHTPGGSSGGSAAAVAAGIVSAATGGDGAGSIRIPAAWCGLVGLKPQRGRVSTWPDPDAFFGLTCYGPLTRTAADAALLLDAIAGNHPRDIHRPPPPPRPFAETAARDPGRLRIALSFKLPPVVDSSLDGEIEAAVRSLADRLESLGHAVEEADPAYGLVGLSLIARGTGGQREWCRRLDDHAALEPRSRQGLAVARVTGAAPLVALARRREPAIRRRIGRIFERYDLVLTPTTAQPPPRVGALDGAGWWRTNSAGSHHCPYAFPWNVTGWPGISVPAGTTTAGLPIGAQLLAGECGEGTLLALAGQLDRERESGESRRE